MTLSVLESRAKACTLCQLSATRKQVVFGEGLPTARLLFIGEAPGKDEDASGHPFVGRAGQLLTRIIEHGLKMQRSEVYIANVVKCRPTVDGLGKRDRPPAAEEIAKCAPYLMEQIEFIRPEVIVTLGNPSTRFLLQTKEGITKLRGKWHSYRGVPVMPTFHPSFLLRNGGDASDTAYKLNVWSDMAMVARKLQLVT